MPKPPTQASLFRREPTHPPLPTDRRRILLTGARGFVGSHLLTLLVERGWEVVAVSRHLRADGVPDGVIQVAADIAGHEWQRWCEGCSAAIHLIGIIREVPKQKLTFDRVHRLAAERVIAACKEYGIRRLLHMSALGTRAEAATEYQHSKWQAEEIVRASGLDWTIFRPSVIFGPGDGFATTLARALRRSPVFPVFGDGAYRTQPIAVEEVGRAFLGSLDDGATVGRVYELGGPEALTFDEALRRTAFALGLRRTLVHVPLGLSRLLVSLAQLLPSAPITRDQLTMLLEGSTCDTQAERHAFGIPQAKYEGPVWLRDPR